jgi:hypothetical protein
MPRAETSPLPSVGHESIVGTLRGPILRFGLAGELNGLHGDELWPQSMGQSSKRLVKFLDLHAVLIAMKANTLVTKHSAGSKSSVHSLQGHLWLLRLDQVLDLLAGHLITAMKPLPDGEEASEDSADLLTLPWPPKSCNGSPRQGRRTRPCARRNTRNTQARFLTVMSGVLVFTGDTATGRREGWAQSASR